jgi:hypothetical protein
MGLIFHTHLSLGAALIGPLAKAVSTDSAQIHSKNLRQNIYETTSSLAKTKTERQQRRNELMSEKSPKIKRPFNDYKRYYKVVSFSNILRWPPPPPPSGRGHREYSTGNYAAIKHTLSCCVSVTESTSQCPSLYSLVIAGCAVVLKIVERLNEF